MSMTGICPSCCLKASIELFLTEKDHRAVQGIIIGIPDAIGTLAFQYLSLFNPQTGRTMQIKKAARLLEEIREMTTKGYVHVQGRVDRTCPPKLWAIAIERMLEQRNGLDLPMENHRYLCKIAWGLADEQDARQEKAKINAPRARSNSETQQPVAACLRPMDQWIQGLREDKPSDEECKAWERKQLR